MLVTDYHTHTQYSHGKGTVEENVLAGIFRGLRRLGIAEHGPGHLFFPVKWEALLRLRREIDRMNEKYGGQIEVLMGLEANLLGEGATDIPADTSIFDFMLLGYHKGTAPVDRISRGWMRALLFRQGKRHAKPNAEAYLRAMDAAPGLLGITHPGTYIPVDIRMLAEGAAARGVALELNESHHSMSLDDLRIAQEAGASFFLGSDAHRPERVGVVTNSLALAKEAGALGRVINWA